MNKTKNGYYYDIENDVDDLSGDFWVYIIIGGRNTGKTYSSLKSCYLQGRKFVFVKRTLEDVALICDQKKQENEPDADFSPFKSINRDLDINVRAYRIKKGIGGFYDCDEDGQPKGLPIGYIVSLSGVSKVKGFDLSDCDWIIFDEFIPQPWERINRREGEQLLDLYKTVSRDREHRGKKALKLICLANATKISNPVCNILEITDKLVDMQIGKASYYKDMERGIFVHQIKDNAAFMEEEAKSKIYKAMAATDWGRMALNNEFGYDDFTAVKHSNLKNYIPMFGVKFRSKTYYIYNKEGEFYMCLAPSKVQRIYNLKVENDQKALFIDWIIDLQEASIDGRMIFEQYTMYDLIMNYKTFFKL